MMRPFALVLCALAYTALAGCPAEHLTPSHGKATAEFYRMQLVDPQAGEKNAVLVGLDSSEASIVAQSYYDSLVAQGEAPEQGEQVLILSPTKQSEALMPPPSVPEGSK